MVYQVNNQTMSVQEVCDMKETNENVEDMIRTSKTSVTCKIVEWVRQKKRIVCQTFYLLLTFEK